MSRIGVLLSLQGVVVQQKKAELRSNRQRYVTKHKTYPSMEAGLPISCLLGPIYWNYLKAYIEWNVSGFMHVD